MKENKNTFSLIFYKATITYKGTYYHGWQSQPNGSGIVDAIKKTIFSVWGYQAKIDGASRTDAGVHALGQVAKIELPEYQNINALQKVLNDHLPPDIICYALERCDKSFYPRYHVKEKEYRYYISFDRPTPFEHEQWWYCYYPCDREYIKEILIMFIGKHDFRAFCKYYSDEEAKSIRTINEINFLEQGTEKLIICIKGKSFVRHMIRRIIGAAVTASHKKLSKEYIQEVLLSKKFVNNLYKAPAHGLVLYKITY